MDDLFKGLDGFETNQNVVPSDWNKLEKQLNKKRKKGFIWFGTSLFGMLLIATTGLALFGSNFTTKPKLVAHKPVDRHIPESFDFAAHMSSYKDGAHVKNGSKDVQIENAKSSKPFTIAKTSKESIETSNVTHSMGKAPIVGSNTKVIRAIEAPFESQNMNTVEVVKLPILASSVKEPLESQKIKMNEGEKTTSFAIANLTPLELETFSFNYSPNINPETLASTSKLLEPIVKNTFSLCGGLKASVVNTLSSNAKSGYGFGTGAFVQLDYSIGKSLGVGLRLGVNKEFNHDLSYTFLAERKTFLQRSDRFTNVNLKQITASNIEVSFNYRWSDKMITSFGGYYNFPLLSKSQISEYGTGVFSNLSNERNGIKGYRDLLNTNEFGLQFSQTYRPWNGWGITLGFQSGINSRISKSYFPNSSSLKRTEFSIMLSKKIK